MVAEEEEVGKRWRGGTVGVEGKQQRPLAGAGRQEDAALRGEGLICKFGLCKGVFGLGLWVHFLHVKASKFCYFWSGQID